MKYLKSVIIAFALVLCIGLANFSGMFTGNILAQTSPKVKAKILLDYNTGKVLEEENSTLNLPIASVTKLMTLLLTFEAIERGELSLTDNLVASEIAAGMGGSQVFIDANSEYSVLNLIKAVVISSANDASVVLAEKIAGTEEAFVEKMNQRMANLGGKNTNYANCTGLPNPHGFSCAFDVALVLKEVLKYPLYFEVSKIWMEDFLHPSGRVTQIANTNKLLRSFPGCDAGKTGSTGEAGFCFATSAKRGDMRLISVVLGAENSKERFKTSADLLNYGFNNFESKVVLSTDNLENLSLSIKNAKTIPEIAPINNFSVILAKGEIKNFETNFVFENLKAPLSAGSIVGKAIITDSGIVVAEIDLVLKNDIEGQSLLDKFKTILEKW